MYYAVPDDVVKLPNWCVSAIDAEKASDLSEQNAIRSLAPEQMHLKWLVFAQVSLSALYSVRPDNSFNNWQMVWELRVNQFEMHLNLNFYFNESASKT